MKVTRTYVKKYEQGYQQGQVIKVVLVVGIIFVGAVALGMASVATVANNIKPEVKQNAGRK